MRPALHAAWLAIGLLGGCGGSHGGAPDAGAACVSARCLPGNLCVDGQCSLPCRRHSDCPEDQGYQCVAGVGDDGGGATMVCRPGAVAKTPRGYGASCALHLDADCDATSGFACFGHQNDTRAFCTKLDGCEQDADCPSTMYCGHLRRTACTSLTTCATQSDCDRYPGYACTNSGAGTKLCIHPQSCHTVPDDCPLGASCQPQLGPNSEPMLARACVPRASCDPCENDLDCADPSAACVQDSQGTGFCSLPCDLGGTSCDPGAHCAEAGAHGNYCQPNGGACQGDAAPCAACRDDADCGAAGLCVLEQTTGERYCAEPCTGTDGATCPNAPGGAPMACCTDWNTCGLAFGKCLPQPSLNPYPRSSTGCWLRPCQTNGDCLTGELCDVRAESLLSSTNLSIQCGTSGVCRAAHDPTDAVDYQIYMLVCDCSGNHYPTETSLANNRAAAFRGCCYTVSSSSGNTWTCPSP